MKPAFDIDKLAVLQLPIILRRSRLLAFVGVLLSPIGRLEALFDILREDVEYRMAHNSQVTKLRSLLNDLLDEELRRIEIADAEPAGGNVYLYNRELEKPLHIPTRGTSITLYYRGYAPEKDINFVVTVPSDWQDDAALMARLQALVRAYKLASKRYIITYK